MKSKFELITEALYLADPMGTCCVENECTDEYDYVASAIYESIEEGLSVYDAVRDAFINSFSSDIEPEVFDVAAEVVKNALKESE